MKVRTILIVVFKSLDCPRCEQMDQNHTNTQKMLETEDCVGPGGFF